MRTIVFCNKIETCRKVENLLSRAASRQAPGGSGQGSDRGSGQSRQSGYGSSDDEDRWAGQGGAVSKTPAYSVLPYHSAITPKLRAQNLQV